MNHSMTGRSRADRRVGARMLRRREELGLTQDQLAEMIGVTAAQVKAFERGALRVGPGRLPLVAAALRVSLSYFFEEC